MTETKPLSLQVPEPKSRPGDQPDFSYINVPPAGSTRRPAVDCAADSIKDLAFDLVRVLDDKGEAVGPWKMDFDDEMLLKGLQAMMKTRAFDERMLMFSSWRRPGLGRADLWVAWRSDKESDLTDTRNLGVPLNSPFDDGGQIWCPASRTLFFNSTRHSGNDPDIYMSQLDRKNAPKAEARGASVQKDQQPSAADLLATGEDE